MVKEIIYKGQGEGKEALRFEIRTYEPKDKEEVFKLHVKALTAAGAYIGSGIWDDDLKDIGAVYLNSGGDFLVGIVGGKIVAMGALKKLSDEVGEIKRMRTDPDFQRRGFAQAILERLESRARDFGFKSLELDSWFDQIASHRLYTKNGYEEFKREIGKYSGKENIFFRKML